MDASSSDDQIKAFKDFLSNYNKLSEICFADCVWDFTSRKVSKDEDRCSQNCAEKYLRMNQRINTRFQVPYDEIQICNFHFRSCILPMLNSFLFHFLVGVPNNCQRTGPRSDAIELSQKLEKEGSL